MKNEKILMTIVPILLAITAILGYLKAVNTNEKTDAIKFKEEYETLNGEKYVELKINSNNPIKYASYDKLLEVIENGTGIIYLGFPECPWCRSALPVLLDAAKDTEVEVIYYMNIKNSRDSYVIQDGELTYALDENGKEIKGEKGYFKLLKALEKHLSDYKISFEEKLYDVGEKRLYAPSVIFVRDGEVLGIHVATVESHTNPNKKLTTKQYDELYSIYEDYIMDTKGGTCSIGTSC